MIGGIPGESGGGTLAEALDPHADCCCSCPARMDESPTEHITGLALSWVAARLAEDETVDLLTSVMRELGHRADARRRPQQFAEAALGAVLEVLVGEGEAR